MKRWILTLSILAAVGTAAAVAQQPDGPGRNGPPGPGGRGSSPLVEALDADRDGVISAEELKDASAALSKLDKNSDGKLTEEEFRPQGRRPGGPGGEERPGGEDRRAPREGRRGPGQGRPEGPPNGGPDGPPPPPNPDRMLMHAMEFDADKDGKLSKEELQAFVADFVKMHPGPGPEGRRPMRGGPPRERGDDDARPERPRRPQ